MAQLLHDWGWTFGAATYCLIVLTAVLARRPTRRRR